MAESALEAGRADDLLASVQVGRHPEAAGELCTLDGHVPVATPRIRRSRPAAQDTDPLVRRRAVKCGEPAAREELPREIERPALGLATAYGDDLSSRGQRVQPFSRGGHAGPDDFHPVRVAVSLIGVDDPPVALESVRKGEPRMARGEQNVREASLAVELELA